MASTRGQSDIQVNDHRRGSRIMITGKVMRGNRGRGGIVQQEYSGLWDEAKNRRNLNYPSGNVDQVDVTKNFCAGGDD